MTITVIAFDRDLTIDVNFNKDIVNCPDDAEPVPLSTVKELAHNTLKTDCWASGNQHLKREAGIHGISEAKRLWEEYNGRNAENKYEDEGYHSYKPTRREGLRLIRDVYEAYRGEEDIEYVVVDDVPMKYLDGFTHYYAWTFVNSIYAVEDTDFTSTSLESKACNEDVERNHSNLDRLMEEYNG